MVRRRQRHDWRPLTLHDIGYNNRRIDVEVFLNGSTLTKVPAYGSTDWEENWIAAPIAQALIGCYTFEEGASFGERGRIEYTRSLNLTIMINGKSADATFRVLENAENRVNVPMLVGEATIREIWGEAWPPSHLPPSRAPPLPLPLNTPPAPAPHQPGTDVHTACSSAPEVYGQTAEAPFAYPQFPSGYSYDSFGFSSGTPFNPAIAHQGSLPVMSTPWPTGAGYALVDLTGTSAAGFSSAQQAGGIATLLDHADRQPVEGDFENLAVLRCIQAHEPVVRTQQDAGPSASNVVWP
ncbi:hypothetical protein MYCTH_2306396 [Thermothelomyces thermophilus ATCC 42464]|uniref:Uncharacterized protein n=1 Tax=Thermothelomyces thermophilus (strain ATCC 42464 / BCRC 31852 / DSM 1799) TaxID=573729 RepID=G2QHD6_THET4|nr:uncharacterized protein MYCTH_2306396 [Thermothelomyces thermophilus ATCC 42464]AEO58796.1 hypothetical protein MYCTH_2306396 [Thermothelomyces thermophilus ATCC 42464]